MRITIRPRPGTIGFMALFAEVPGQWEERDDTYLKISDNDTSVFMLNDFIIASSRLGDEPERFTPRDLDTLVGKLEQTFISDSADKETVKLFSEEAGAGNVDFSITVGQWLEGYKVHLLEKHMEKFDREMNALFAKFNFANNRDASFRAYAVERYFQNVENLDSVDRLKEIVFAREFPQR